MSTRKITARQVELDPGVSLPISKKKPRPPRVRLTHLEIRRGDALRLRIAVADDAMAELGDELGALIKKIASSTRTEVVAAPVVSDARPSTRTEVVAAPVVSDARPAQPVRASHGHDPEDFFITREHATDDGTYHAELHEYLSALFESLCDTGLDDAIAIARAEHTRRIEGSN